MIRWPAFLLLLALCWVAPAQAQQLDAPKLIAGGVLENISMGAPKLTAYAVMTNVSFGSPKLSAYAVLGGFLPFDLVEAANAQDWLQLLPGGGGGGGAAGPFGVGEAGQNSQLDGGGGYGGSADLFNTARQNTPGAAGNNGTEIGGGAGSGSGGAGGSWNSSGVGQNGGIGGLYGGGGGGGGGGTGGGGLGALGGDGVIVITYSDGVSQHTVILDVSSISPWIVPADWTNDNSIVLIGAGGCGANGSTVSGGGGGDGGHAVLGIDVNDMAPGMPMPFVISTAVAACAGVDIKTTFDGGAASSGENGDGTGGFPGTTGIPGGQPGSGITSPGIGGDGGILESAASISSLHILYRMPFTHFW